MICDECGLVMRGNPDVCKNCKKDFTVQEWQDHMEEINEV